MEKTLDCAMRSGYVFWLAISPNDPEETRRIIIATQCWHISPQNMLKCSKEQSHRLPNGTCDEPQKGPKRDQAHHHSLLKYAIHT